MNFTIMKLELNQTIGIKPKLEYILDLLIDLLLQITDFVVFHSITFGELMLFSLSIFRAVWFLFYGVSNGGNYDYYFSELTWTVIFCSISVVHFLSFFFQKVWVRFVVFLVYAFIWCFLMFLAWFAGTTAPAVPTFAVFTLGCLYLAVRLWYENK